MSLLLIVHAIKNVFFLNNIYSFFFDMLTTILENYNPILQIDLTDLISIPLKNLIDVITHSFALTGDWVLLMTIINPNTNIVKDSKLNPFYVTGFSDAESTFSLRIYKDDKYRTG